MCSHLADDDDACSKSAEAGPALMVNGTNWSYVCWSHLWLTRPGKNAKRTRFAHKFTSIFNCLHFGRPFSFLSGSGHWPRSIDVFPKKLLIHIASPCPNPLERGKPQPKRTYPSLHVLLSRSTTSPLISSAHDDEATAKRNAVSPAQRCTHPQCPHEEPAAHNLLLLFGLERIA
jgi:hypothetical protein